MNIFKSYKKILLIQILAAATALLSVFVDGIVTSKYLGAGSMAAFGFAHTPVTICAALATVFEAGMQVICGKCFGKGDTKGAEKCVNLTIAVSAGLGIIIAFIFFFLSEPVSVLFGAKGELVSEASAYLRGFAPSLLALLSAPSLTAIMQMDGDSRLSIYGVGLMTVVNISLDYANALIFHGGLFGMGLATTIGSYANVLLMMTHFRKKNIMLHLNFKDLVFSDTINILRLGFSSANQLLCTFVRTLFLNIFLFGLAGSVAVAAYTSLNGALPLLLAMANGFGTTTLLVAGVLIGEEDKASLTRLMKGILKLAVSCAVLLGAVVFLFSGVIAGFYVDAADAERFELVRSAFRWFSLSMPLSILTIFFISYYQCLEKSIYSIALSMLENAGFIILYSVILSKFFGVTGIWMSFVCSEITCLLIVLAVSVIKTPRLPSLTSLMLLRDSFGVDEADRINIAVKCPEDAAKLSDRIISFCRDHGIDNKRSLYSGLSLEEMASGIFENNNDKEDIRIDVYICKKGDSLHIHLKDNGRQFDPKEQNKIMFPEDPASNIAIRVFYSLVKKYDYQYLFNMNVMNYEI